MNENEVSESYLGNFLEKVADERDYQLNKWGDEFDSKNTPNDWVAYITQYLGKAVTLPWDSSVFEKYMVKVATLAAAAHEWSERTDGNMPKRHYD